MADKMFVVIIVMSIIFAGVFVYLLSLDRRTKRMEKEIAELEARRDESLM